MKRLRAYWLHGVLGACALLTLALILVPQSENAPAAPPQEKRFAGRDFEARPAARLQNFVLSLSAPAAAASPANAEPLPTLVGLAGRSVYLRSASSGETERLSVGQEFDGWRLVAVGARAITLRGPAGDRRLELFALPDPEPEEPAQAGVSTAQPVGG